MEQNAKPVYTENHEAFRRMLIAGGITFVMGFFFGQQMLDNDLFEALRGWFPVVMWIGGLVAWSMCFVLYPKRYAIYDDRLVIEWWYPRSKVIPFDEIRELEAKPLMGKRNIIVRSQGADYDFGLEMISPRNAIQFSERLEETLNRSRFRSGREPVQMILNEPKKRKQRS